MVNFNIETTYNMIVKQKTNSNKLHLTILYKDKLLDNFIKFSDICITYLLNCLNITVKIDTVYGV